MFINGENAERCKCLRTFPPLASNARKIMEYSFKRGLGKGAVQLLTVIGSLVAFAGFSDLAVWDLVEKYIKPVLGSLTIGGTIAIALNFVKFKFGRKQQDI